MPCASNSTKWHWMRSNSDKARACWHSTLTLRCGFRSAPFSRARGYGTDSVPVLSGLTPQDWVVAAGGHLLHEGQPVRALDRSNRPVQGD